MTRHVLFSVFSDRPGFMGRITQHGFDFGKPVENMPV